MSTITTVALTIQGAAFQNLDLTADIMMILADYDHQRQRLHAEYKAEQATDESTTAFVGKLTKLSSQTNVAISKMKRGVKH